MADRTSNLSQRAAFDRGAVERLVRQVLAELAARQGSVNSSQEHAQAGTGELLVPGKIVSLKQVEGRLAGITRVVFERGAVLTPAARDELKKFKVTIASAASAGKVSARVLRVATCETKYDPQALVSALAGDGIDLHVLPDGGLIATVDALTGAVAMSAGCGLLLTGQPAAALCLANRTRGVRAVGAANVAEAGAALASVGANLLVVDPQGKSTFELRQLARLLARDSRRAPAALAERLG